MKGNSEIKLDKCQFMINLFSLRLGKLKMSMYAVHVHSLLETRIKLSLNVEAMESLK